MTLSPEQRRDYLAFATSIAREAGEVTLHYFRNDPEIRYKADRTPVTIADREAEALLRSRITNRYPGHGILGEEEGFTPGEESLTWVLDPIDGTKAFVSGVAQYSVLVALVQGHYSGAEAIPASAVEVGVIHIPPLDESVRAARGAGATWLNGGTETPARVSTVTSLGKARITTTDFAELMRREPSIFNLIANSRARTRTYGDAYGYLLVATGRYDVMIDPILSPWDIGPLPVIIEEAGGTFTDLAGDAIVGKNAIATNGLLHEQILSHRD